MKHSIKTLLCAATIFFVGCEKDTISELPQTDGIKIDLVTFEDPDKALASQTMLSFNSWQDFEAKVTDLENQVEAQENGFLSTSNRAALSDVALNDAEDASGYNDQQALIDFEANLNFTNSLRKKFNTEEDLYLADDVLDPSKDPNTKYLFDDEELSLLNSNQEVKIGNSVYRFSENGYIKISSNYASALSRLNSGDLSVLNESYVEQNNSSRASNCSGWRSSSADHNYAHKRKAVRIATFRTAGPYSKSKVKVISYKKRSSGWRRWRTNLGVAVTSRFFDKQDCITQSHASSSGWKRKKRKKLKKTHSTFARHKVKKFISVYGHYEYNGRSSNYSLRW